MLIFLILNYLINFKCCASVHTLMLELTIYSSEIRSYTGHKCNGKDLQFKLSLYLFNSVSVYLLRNKKYLLLYHYLGYTLLKAIDKYLLCILLTLK